MSVKIRLRRMGRKKQPHYRVVVADSASPRDGRFVESLGYYKPLTHPARLVVDLERVDYWISQGALPSDTVKSLISKARKGGDETVAVGEPDLEAERARKAEALATKRKGEKDAEAKEPEAPAEAKQPEAPAEEAPTGEVEVEAAPEADAPEEAEATPEPEATAEPEAAAEPTAEAASEEAEAPGGGEEAEEKKAEGKPDAKPQAD